MQLIILIGMFCQSGNYMNRWCLQSSRGIPPSKYFPSPPNSTMVHWFAFGLQITPNHVLGRTLLSAEHNQFTIFDEVSKLFQFFSVIIMLFSCNCLESQSFSESLYHFVCSWDKVKIGLFALLYISLFDLQRKGPQKNNKN